LDKVWPELDVKSTFWNGGEDAGLKQTFLTPGLIFGRIKLHGHLLMAVGAGFQIAATHYHQYTRRLSRSVSRSDSRLPTAGCDPPETVLFNHPPRPPRRVKLLAVQQVAVWSAACPY